MNEIKELRKILKINSDERIGQFIWNRFAGHGLWNSPEANSLFFISDREFTRVMGIYSNPMEITVTTKKV